MSSYNCFELLAYVSDDNSDTEIENKSTCYDTKRHKETKTVNSEFLNSESANNKKRPLKKRTDSSNHQAIQAIQAIQDCKKVLRVNKVRTAQVYDEIGKLPSSLDVAVKMRQNLTLKQILVLMNLYAIPGMIVNSIHDYIQRQVHKMVIKISHDGRVFYVSQYHWYDLKKIEVMIDTMFNTY